MRRALLPVLLALAVALPAAGPSLSALRIGTDNGETLAGTDGNDQLTGNGGGDILKGRAGNDTYYFDDNFSTPGQDLVVERPGEGTDAINFRAVNTNRVVVNLVREWAGIEAYNATGPGGEVRFTYREADGTLIKSFIEKVVGSRGSGDIIQTGGRSHTLMPGGGADDDLVDLGGWDDGPGGKPEIPASDDLFKGFADNTGTDFVSDFGGTADTVDLRPLSTDDVYLTAIDEDGNGTRESLQIVMSERAQVVILGHFAPRNIGTQHGRIEQLIFADETITDSAAKIMTTASVESLSPKQQRLARAAPRLARQARARLAHQDPTGAEATGRSGDASAEGRRATAAPRAQAEIDTKGKKLRGKNQHRAGAMARGDGQGKHRPHRRR
jgi:hypothetical protein